MLLSWVENFIENLQKWFMHKDGEELRFLRRKFGISCSELISLPLEDCPYAVLNVNITACLASGIRNKK